MPYFFFLLFDWKFKFSPKLVTPGAGALRSPYHAKVPGDKAFGGLSLHRVCQTGSQLMSVLLSSLLYYHQDGRRTQKKKYGVRRAQIRSHPELL